ncbi:OmpA/MotB [Enhygromyxa salina]|uniref:OmpA/MotB n=2 Tax=Enhygromyxa salina TaxID=215803 RepID=A0A0C2CP81_9BACT|nr:OmpA/MotB [Enhygromyxa salina]
MALALALALAHASCASDEVAPGSEHPLAVVAPEPEPEPDPDKDGVAGSSDKCPGEPGLPPDGCPLRDADQDGVLDPDDACPEQRECVNGFDDLDGCPDVLPADLAEVIGVIEGLEFPPDKWDIEPASRPVLDRLAGVLARYPTIELEIAGHIDERAPQLRRRQPSRRRAEAVRDYLIRQGIEPQRLRAVGYGPDVPIADNRTAEGRALNRRVEIVPIRPPWGDDATCDDALDPDPS